MLARGAAEVNPRLQAAGGGRNDKFVTDAGEVRTVTFAGLCHYGGPPTGVAR
jgi:hypothetical protein